MLVNRESKNRIKQTLLQSQLPSD